MSKRDITVTPTNLLSWPRIAPMLPDLKLIIRELWSMDMGCAGCALVALRPFAAILGLSPEALKSGIEILEEKGLIVTDANTGEIFLRDWFRFHRFNTGLAYSMLKKATDKIESAELRTLVLSSMPAKPESKETAPAKAKAPQPQQHRHTDAVDEQTGALLLDDADKERLAALIAKHGLQLIRKAVDGIRNEGGRPFISTIYSSLNETRDRVGREFDPTRVRGPAVQRIGCDDEINYAAMGSINPANPVKSKF